MVLASQKKARATRDASVPPKPTTEAIAGFGKISEMVEYIVADQPWCAAAARAKNAVASHTLLTRGVSTTGSVQHAQTKRAVLRARLMGHPIFRNQADSAPPTMLPRAVTAPIAARGNPKPLMS